MRLLVTGGAGFIGSRVVAAALNVGHQVTVLDSLAPSVHPRGVADLPPEVRFVRGDVQDPLALADALRDVEAICHQAAKVGLGVDFSDTPEYVAVNDHGTAVLLAKAQEWGIKRLVLASSMVVYGEGAYASPTLGSIRPPARAERDLAAGRFDPLCPDTGVPLEPGLVGEDAPLDPRNTYAATKVMQEYLSGIWARGTGGRVAALRYHNVYGPRMPKDTPYAGVASIFRSALARGEVPRIFEDGRQRRDFVHVDDVAAANLVALDWTAPDRGDPGQLRPYNVGSGEVHTIGELAGALSAASIAPAPAVTGEYRIGDVRHITASSRRIRDELGWKPQVSFEIGMRSFANEPLRGE
ncbi:MAG: NAD-dependent epimerase/dehydratase family protein [Mycobacteriales bacterium]